MMSSATLLSYVHARIARLTAIAGLALGLSPIVASAGMIGFDPDGGSDNYLNVSQFDFAPGNALFKDLGSLLVNKANQQITNLMQTRLSTLRSPDGTDILPVGLNANYEITAYVGFSALANVSGNKTAYALNAPGVGAANYFELWYDSNVGTFSNDLAGTGFNNGTMILSGTITSAQGNFTRFGSPTLFDQFGAQNYPGTTSYRVAGGVVLNIDVDTADATFFQQVPPLLTVGLYNSSNITAFTKVNPSLLFGVNPANQGLVNGTGTDFQAQIDPNATFEAIPEPTTWSLIGIGLIGMAWYGRRQSGS